MQPRGQLQKTVSKGDVQLPGESLGHFLTFPDTRQTVDELILGKEALLKKKLLRTRVNQAFTEKH